MMRARLTEQDDGAILGDVLAHAEQLGLLELAKVRGSDRIGFMARKERRHELKALLATHKQELLDFLSGEV